MPQVNYKHIISLLYALFFLNSNSSQAQLRKEFYPKINIQLGTPIYWGHARPLSFPRNDLLKSEYSPGIRIGTSWTLYQANSEIGWSYGLMSLRGYKEGFSWGPMTFFQNYTHEFLLRWHYSLNHNIGFFYAPFNTNLELGLGAVMFESLMYKYPNFETPTSGVGTADFTGPTFSNPTEMSSLAMIGLSFNFVVMKHWVVTIDNTLNFSYTNRFSGFYPSSHISAHDSYSFSSLGLSYLFYSPTKGKLYCPKGMSRRSLNLKKYLHW